MEMRRTAVPIARAIEHSTGKPVILASVYNTLERLEEKGLGRVDDWSAPPAERGGRAKRLLFHDHRGLREVRGREEGADELWRGIPVHEG